MSGLSLGQSGLIARLKTPRGLIAVAVVGLGLAGGYYYFANSSPQIAGAMTTPSGNNLKQSAVRRGASTRPAAVAVTPVAPVVAQPTIIVREADPLGAAYLDKANGFSIRFPSSWAIRTFAPDPWVLDSGDPTNGMISIGFIPCPASLKADQLLPESIARRIKKTPGTTLNARGKTVVAGHSALWFKSTGPLPMTNGSPVMTRVQYIVPLGDGRILEIRVAAPPVQFGAIANVMKESIETFWLIPGK